MHTLREVTSKDESNAWYGTISAFSCRSNQKLKGVNIIDKITTIFLFFFCSFEKTVPISFILENLCKDIAGFKKFFEFWQIIYQSVPVGTVPLYM